MKQNISCFILMFENKKAKIYHTELNLNVSENLSENGTLSI